MTIFLVLLLGLLGALIFFVVTHLRPLSDQEVDQVARKRRKRAADAYFSFEQKRMTVDSFSLVSG